MPYRFAQENRDYSDYASGRVFYSAPGHPAFPVRLVSEVFQRCQAIRQKRGLTGPVSLYDPCCGSAYHLSSLAYLHWPEIGTISGSDIDTGILPFAARNLGLLTPQGLEKRAEEIATLFKLYGKPSHAEALKSVQLFKRQLSEYSQTHSINTQLFEADATNSQQMLRGLQGRKIDIILADVPYGQQSKWQSATTEMTNESLLIPMLEALLPVLSPDSIVTIISDKSQKCDHPHYQRLGRFQVGKRLVIILQPG
jgi:23S rRNA (guanine2535-N1)-methyltransferase